MTAEGVRNSPFIDDDRGSATGSISLASRSLLLLPDVIMTASTTDLAGAYRAGAVDFCRCRAHLQWAGAATADTHQSHVQLAVRPDRPLKLGGSHRRPAECACRCHDRLTDPDIWLPLLATAWVAEPYVLASWASAMPPHAVALRGDLTQAELKTAWNAGLNDAARRHRGSIEIQGETKR